MLLFKIVDATCGNYGMTYHTGLNENTNGMWFVEAKDIFSYINYGCMVVVANTCTYERESGKKFVYEEDGECMYEGGSYIKGYKTNAIWVTAIWPIEAIYNTLLGQGADITTPPDPGVFIRWALYNNKRIFDKLQSRFPNEVNKYVNEWYERNRCVTV